ncbi:MAG: dTDP-glucose 4,6-dehydratase [Gemmatimonadales bacterium]|nr:MAG: dTDP-glucose 4,6-dehydratase [Gemmatimonadales bacterium]
MHRTILVTGGAGFIGSALVRHLVRDTDVRVINVDCLTYAGSLASLSEVSNSPRYALEQVDIRNREAVRSVFQLHRPDAVIHLAAESHVDRSIDEPALFMETNVMGTFNLLEASRELLQEGRGGGTSGESAFRFVHVSTDEVFGSLGESGAFSEESPHRPNSPYAASKAAADHLARSWHRTFGVPVITTNCSNNYGPHQFPEKLIPHMIISALEGKDLPVYGDGRQTRDWLFVEDHVRALMRILARGTPGEVYLVGGGAEWRNIDLVTELCRILDDLSPSSDGRSHAKRIVMVPDRPGHDRRYAVDAGKVTRDLGWSPVESFESGLRKTVTWYLERSDWWEPLRTRVYAGQRLGVLQ